VTTSDYLKIQAELLIAVKELRSTRLEEFVAKARGVAYDGGALRDRDGWPVVSDSERMAEIAEAAMEFRDRALRRGPGSAGQATGQPMEKSA
jgi:hypothetical protein